MGEVVELQLAEKIGFTPIGNRVVLRKEEQEKIGSIIVPDSVQARHAPDIGVVLKAGEDCCEVIHALVGKRVIHATYAGTHIQPGGKDGQKYFICEEGDIYGPLEDMTFAWETDDE